MKHIRTGPNEIYFSLLRDLPFFQPVTSNYAMTVKSMDTSVEKTVMLRDSSAKPESYQTFAITGSTTTEDLEQGMIKMIPFGMFYFKIYPVSGSTLAHVDTTQTLYSGIIYSKE